MAATIRLVEVIRGKWQIEADDNGSTYRHFHVFSVRTEAEAVRARIMERNGTLRLANSPHWTQFRRVNHTLAPMSIVCYKIPTLATEAGCPMPCNTFRPIAGRIDGSVWVIPTDRIPYVFLHSLTTEWKSGFPRLTWHVVPIDSNAASAMLQIVLQNMQDELQGQLDRAAAIRQKHEAKLAAAEADSSLTDEQRTEALAAYQRNIKAAIARTEKVLEDIREASKGFGISERLPLSAVLDAVSDINQQMRERSRAYSEAARRAGRYAPVAQRSEIPAGVLADMLDDAGEDTSELRRTFGV